MNLTASQPSLIPQKAPDSVFGTLLYYQWREADRKRRIGDEIKASYYISYGDKYASRFMETTYDHLSEKGKRWSRRVFIDLQSRLEETLSSFPEIERETRKFSEVVYRQHVQAYRNAGFHRLPFRDKWLIIRSIDLKDWISFHGRRSVRRFIFA